MKQPRPTPLIMALMAALATPAALAAPTFSWTTVVNNANIVPGSTEGLQFFSYNQPSINAAGLVAFRARARSATGGDNGGSQGNGEPVSGIFTYDPSAAGSPLTALAVRGDAVPAPNNVTQPGPATFNEFPSFPRIDATSDTVAFRAQSTPSWVTVLPDGTETRSGTAGLYVTPGGGALSTAMRNTLPGSFEQYQVPGQATPTRFDQFPGAASPTGNTVSFKGNWTDASGVAQTGVYFRDVVANGGAAPVVEIARRGQAIPANAIPATGYSGSGLFGSTSPPSAAGGKMVFTGLDVEEAPTAGGIFMAPLTANPTLTTVASFNTVVPKNGGQTLRAFGEGVSFDGRYVGFWGGWGTETFSKQVSCAADGNADVRAYCVQQDRNGVANDGIYNFNVLKNQGIFLADTQLGKIYLVAQTGTGRFDDFLFWTFSGHVPGQGSGDEELEEGARWRSSSFLAIDGNDIIFKALHGDVSGLYGALDVTDVTNDADLFTMLETGMDGGLVDPAAAGLPIVSLGIERDGFRNGRLAINVGMANADAGWAGIYVTQVPEPNALALALGGLLAAAGTARRRKG